MTESSAGTAASPREPLRTHHLSHDLRGPLNSILGFSELLLDGIEGPLNEIQIEDISAMRQSALSLLQQINLVVDLDKAAAGLLSLSPTLINFQQAVTYAIDELPAGKQARLILAIPDKLPQVYVDINRTREIITILINYLFSKQPAGTITLMVSLIDSGLELQLSQAEVVLSPAQVDDLFQLTVEPGRNRHDKITEGGLKLPLAYRLAQAQNSTLTVTSDSTQGTIFTLCLPLSD